MIFFKNKYSFFNFILRLIQRKRKRCYLLKSLLPTDLHVLADLKNKIYIYSKRYISQSQLEVNLNEKK